MNIKVVILDIDGTLYNDEKKILPKTKKALLEIQKQGVKLILASGRPASGLWHIVDELEMDKYHGLICAFNGAEVIDTTTKEVLVHTPMSQEEARSVIKHVKNYNVVPMAYKDAYLYVEDAYAYKVEYESRLCHLMVCEVNEMENYINWNPNKVLVSGDPSYLKEVSNDLKKPFPNLNCVFTAPFYFEFTAKGIDKAKAVNHAINQLGYTSENCMSFGDAENDLSMIKYAKIGVAMENGQRIVKEAANEITLDNNSEGIYHTLKKYFSLDF